MSNFTYSEMDFAKLDLSREERTGFPEVVFCQGKEDTFLIDIYKKLYKENGFKEKSDAEALIQLLQSTTNEAVVETIEKKKEKKSHHYKTVQLRKTHKIFFGVILFLC